MWTELKTDIKMLFAAAWNTFKRDSWIYIPLLLLSAMATMFLFPHDQAISRIVTTNYFNRFWWFYAGELSHFGAFERASLLFIGILFIAGIAKKNRPWRCAALACLLACALAGIAANIGKSTTGRPRPNSGVEQDGFYGPTLDNDYKSFPSAHSATSLATAASLSIIFPAVAVPLGIFEFGVALSRIYVKGHYPTDVLIGCTIGLFFGTLFGIACRKITRNGKGVAR